MPYHRPPVWHVPLPQASPNGSGRHVQAHYQFPAQYLAGDLAECRSRTQPPTWKWPADAAHPCIQGTWWPPPLGLFPLSYGQTLRTYIYEFCDPLHDRYDCEAMLLTISVTRHLYSHNMLNEHSKPAPAVSTLDTIT